MQEMEIFQEMKIALENESLVPHMVEDGQACLVPHSACRQDVCAKKAREQGSHRCHGDRRQGASHLEKME